MAFPELWNMCTCVYVLVLSRIPINNKLRVVPSALPTFVLQGDHRFLLSLLGRKSQNMPAATRDTLGSVYPVCKTLDRQAFSFLTCDYIDGNYPSLFLVDLKHSAKSSPQIVKCVDSRI